MGSLQERFYTNFIEDSRWHYIADGLKVTLVVTFCAVIIGVVLGFLLAIVRSTYDKTGRMKILNALCQAYITVIRGTPVVVQLLIIYFVIFGCGYRFVADFVRLESIKITSTTIAK